MQDQHHILYQNKVFGWLAAATAAILSIPLVAMQFSTEVDWQLNDFIIMGILIFGAGTTFIALARLAPSKYHLLIGLGVAAALLLTWAHLAVGLVDSWPLAGS